MASQFPRASVYADANRFASMQVGYVNFYAYPDGTGFWGKPHDTRKQAENAARYCGWDGKKVAARLVVRRKAKRRAGGKKEFWG